METGHFQTVDEEDFGGPVLGQGLGRQLRRLRRMKGCASSLRKHRQSSVWRPVVFEAGAELFRDRDLWQISLFQTFKVRSLELRRRVGNPPTDGFTRTSIRTKHVVG